MPHSDHHQPASKRQRLAGPEPKLPAALKPASAIFAPFRTIGLVSPTNVPFTSLPLGKTTFQITTSVGRALQTYDLKRGLNLVFVSRPQTPENITATYAWKKCIYAAWGHRRNGEGQGLWVFQRGKKVAELELPQDLDQPITQILIFGSWVIGCALARIEVWKSTTLEHYTTIFPIASKTGDNELTGGVRNMPTYLNKIFAGRKDGWVEVWNVSTGKLIYTILPSSPRCGAVTCLEPTPALSLLAIAYSEGPLVVHNVLTDKPVLQLVAGTQDAPVTSISFRSDGMGAGPDGRKDGVMATAAHGTGDVTFWDLNKRGRVMGILRSAHNPPSATSARSGAQFVRGGISRVEFLPGQPVIMTSGLDNSLKSWIFDETPSSPIPRILHQRCGHAAPVNCLQFLPSDFDGADAGNKWLLSGGQDRSLWGWSLRRDGQSTELSQGNMRKKAKKAGLLAGASLKLGHGPTTTLDDLKAPEITCIASSLNRDGGIGAIPGKQPIWDKGSNRLKATNAEISAMTGWESVVTGHKGDPWARTWFWGRKRAGRWALKTGDAESVSAVAMSPCGTFALVGSAGGSIGMFNLQSGHHRRHFPSKLTPSQLRQIKMQQLRQLDGVRQLHEHSACGFAPGTGRHTAAVTGIVVDPLNKFVISCSLDGTIKFWDFVTGHLTDEISLAPAAQPTGSRFHASNDLCAFACADGSIRVIDVETKHMIREFRGGGSSSGDGSSSKDGPAAAINDFCFSNSGRWVVAASADAVIRVWDLPTGHLIDAFRLASPCTALAFSGSDEFLAAAAEGAMGVQLWTNRTLFRHVPTRQVSEREIRAMDGGDASPLEPTASGEGGQGLIDAAFEDEEEQEQGGGEAEDPVSAPEVDQLSADMMTLSLVPRSRWQTLLHLDLIKQRNKPKEAPKKPEKAPFFLPSVGGGQTPGAANLPTVAPADEKRQHQEEGSAIESRITQLDRRRDEYSFTSKLLAGAATGNYENFVEHLKSLSPSAADLELRSLSMGYDDSDGENDEADATPATQSSNELLHFVRAMTSRLAARRDYELTQAWMAVFLRLHTDAIVGEGGGGRQGAAVVEALRRWREVQARERERLDDLVGYCSGVIGFLRSPRT